MELKKIVMKYGLSRIEKVVGEYNVYGIENFPYEKIKVKIYLKSNKKMIGYTNLQYRDGTGDYFSGVGHGETENETLQDTINNFLSHLGEDCKKEDFIYSDMFDF